MKHQENKAGVVYDPSTGEILGYLRGTQECVESAPAFMEQEEYVDTSLYYVETSGKKPVLREKQRLEISVEHRGLQAIIRGIPCGSRVVVNDSELVVDDTLLEIEADRPKSVFVFIDPPVNYQNESMEISLG